MGCGMQDFIVTLRYLESVLTTRPKEQGVDLIEQQGWKHRTQPKSWRSDRENDGGTEGPDSSVKQKVSCMKMRKREEKMALRSGLVNVVDDRALHRKREHGGLTSFAMLWLRYPGTQNRWSLYG